MFASSQSSCSQESQSSSKRKGNAAEEHYLDSVWDLRFEAYGISSTLFVDPQDEAQLIFGFASFKAKPFLSEGALLKSVIRAGGGVFLTNAHDAVETQAAIDDEDWPNHKSVHLVPSTGLGPTLNICARCDAPIVSVHFVFECARANKLFALGDFKVAPKSIFRPPEIRPSDAWKRNRQDAVMYEYRLWQRMRKAEIRRKPTKDAVALTDDDDDDDDAGDADIS